ncbi:long-chain fatty acid transport protein 4 [Sarcoptes scabiei]|nr:long-chain fatty acid transport protein 4 [Sarcoptes scabiei]
MDEESEILYQEFIKSFLENDETKTKNSFNKNDASEEAKIKEISLFGEDDDEDPNDPEYNVFQDLSSLDFDEFLSFYNQIYNNDCTNESSNEIHDHKKRSPEKVKEKDDREANTFTDVQLNILHHQLNFHVQTLIQSWILSFSYKNQTIEEGCEDMLSQLNTIAKNQDDKAHLMYYVRNIKPSIDLISNHKKKIAADELLCEFRQGLSLKSKMLFTSRRDIFVYDWALPSRRFDGPSATIFTPGNDYLIAFGIDDFNRNQDKKQRSLYKYIHLKYLPTHSPKCIHQHVKNLRRGFNCHRNVDKEKLDQNSKFNEWWSNPIISYFREKKLPLPKRFFTEENLFNIHTIESPPQWFKKFTCQIEKKSSTDDDSSRKLAPQSNDQPRTCILPKVEVHKLNSIVENHTLKIVQTPVHDSNQIFKILNTDPKLDAHLEEIRRNTLMYRQFKTHRSNQSKNHKNIGNINLKSNHSQNESISESIQQPMEDAIEYDDVNDAEIRPQENQSNFNDVNEENCDYENMMDEDNEELNYQDKIDVEDDRNENLMDNENDLMALMAASWTTVSNRSKYIDGQQHITSRKKSDLLALHMKFSKLIFGSEKWRVDQEKFDSIIEYYLKKSQRILLQEDYIQFLDLISKTVDFSSSNIDWSQLKAENLFDEMGSFLKRIKTKYSDDNCQIETSKKQSLIDGIDKLIELRILFLNFFEAQNCDQSFEFMHWKRILEFFGKVELYLDFIYPKKSQQQSCLQKMIRSLNQIAQLIDLSENEKKSKIKAVIAKILNNHPLLMEELSLLFLDDHPIQYLFSNEEDFEEIIINNDSSTQDDDVIVSIPENNIDSKFGTSECPCSACHIDRNIPITTHCKICSIRFISGRIYFPHVNNKKLQLIEYVQPKDMKFEFGDEKFKADASETLPKKEWTIAEDRFLLEACRSMILNSHITELNEDVIKKISTNLVSEFQYKREFNEIKERLLHLIEMMTSNSRM